MQRVVSMECSSKMNFTGAALEGPDFFTHVVDKQMCFQDVCLGKRVLWLFDSWIPETVTQAELFSVTLVSLPGGGVHINLLTSNCGRGQWKPSRPVRWRYGE